VLQRTAAWPYENNWAACIQLINQPNGHQLEIMRAALHLSRGCCCSHVGCCCLANHQFSRHSCFAIARRSQPVSRVDIVVLCVERNGSHKDEDHPKSHEQPLCSALPGQGLESPDANILVCVARPQDAVREAWSVDGVWEVLQQNKWVTDGMHADTVAA